MERAVGAAPAERPAGLELTIVEQLLQELYWEEQQLPVTEHDHETLYGEAAAAEDEGEDVTVGPAAEYLEDEELYTSQQQQQVEKIESATAGVDCDGNSGDYGSCDCGCGDICTAALHPSAVAALTEALHLVATSGAADAADSLRVLGKYTR